MIELAAVAWQLPQKHYVHLARTLRFIGKMYQAAALAKRAELRLLREDSSE